MRTLIGLTVLLSLSFVVDSVSAQTPPGMPGKAKEHEFLKKFVGEWDAESEGGGMKGKALLKSKMLGDFWVVNSSDHDISGMEVKSLQMIGYDVNRKKFVGIWADTATSFMWQYEGTVDDTGKKITLEAKGPSMSGDGAMVKYRDAYEFKDDDTIIATSSMQGADGKWEVFMKGTAKRRKAK